MLYTPGESIIAVESYWDNYVGFQFCCWTAGSILRALSLDDYCELRQQFPQNIQDGEPKNVQEFIEQGERFPYVIEFIAPLDAPLECDHYLAGKINWILLLKRPDLERYFVRFDATSDQKTNAASEENRRS